MGDGSAMERGGELTIVLVRTRNPLNIGAVARAMQNFGVRDLRLAEPFAASFREARSAVGAGQVMAAAREFSSVAEAVADCRLVVGTTTARRRELEQPVVALEEAAGAVRRALTEGKVALLFGSEKHGLTRADLDRCHWLVRIATDAEQPSMNLGQAAAVCLWELTRAQRAPATIREGKREGNREGNEDEREMLEARASAGEIARLHGVLMEVLEAGGYVQAKTAASTAAEALRMLHRLRVTDADARLLMGMARKLLWRLRAGERG